MFERLILKWTHRLWNRQISRILCRAYEDRVIDSKQMHVLASAFDPTHKDHQVYGPRIRGGFHQVYKCTVDDVIDEQVQNGSVEWSDEKRAAMRSLRS